jgi:cholinesterase
MAGRRFTLMVASVAVVLTALTSFANADSFSAVVVYGDSLSDNGNLHALTGLPPSPPYDQRFSNGPVAVEQLATMLGAPLHDFAFGGATSGIGNYGDGGTQTSPGLLGLPGMQVELAASAPILTPPLTSTALFVVWGGANDFLVNGSVATAASNIDSIVATLQAAGAQQILVPGMPDLGLTPDYHGNSLATAYAQQFNALLLASLPAGAIYVDTFDALRSIVANPGAYGLTNVTDPCLNGIIVCANPDQYLFWDGFHPTTATDAIVANEFAAAVTTTPEPSSIVLIGTGMSGLLVLARRKYRRAPQDLN